MQSEIFLLSSLKNKKKKYKIRIEKIRSKRERELNRKRNPQRPCPSPAAAKKQISQRKKNIDKEKTRKKKPRELESRPSCVQLFVEFPFEFLAFRALLSAPRFHLHPTIRVRRQTNDVAVQLSQQRKLINIFFRPPSPSTLLVVRPQSSDTKDPHTRDSRAKSNT